MTKWFRFTEPKPLMYKEFSSWPVPLGKDFGGIPCGMKLPNGLEDPSIVACKNLLGATAVRNAVVYSPMSGMYWHTNADCVGLRTYYTFSLDKAVFKYRDPKSGAIIEDWDDIGWTAREFQVSSEDPLWHCVWTSGRRFSFGFV